MHGTPGILSLLDIPALDDTFGALLIGTFIGLMYARVESTSGLLPLTLIAVGNMAGL